MKCFCVLFKIYLVLLSLDDKSKVPYGHGNFAVNTGVPPHGRAVFCGAGSKPIDGLADHDFHLGSLTPSGVLIVDIPEYVVESWHQGQLYVVLKDSVSQSSNPTPFDTW